MSTVSSPSRFSSDYDKFYDPNFTVDISNKMRVPRRIRVGASGDDDLDVDYSKMMDPPKIEMSVPGRILVGGQESHLGLKSPPRELHLEQSMLASQPSVRVQTPPRVLTLEEHPFPTVDEKEAKDAKPSLTGSEMTLSTQTTSNTAIDQSISLSYPCTPPLTSGPGDACPSEEVLIIRRHLAKLSRRVMVLEHENHQRQQREVLVYSAGLAYFILKAVVWLHRNW